MKRTLFLLLLLLVAATALLHQQLRVLVRGPRAPLAASLAPAGTQRAPRIESDAIIGYGTSRARRAVRLSAQVAGSIVELPRELRAGSQVRQGDCVLRIDGSEYRRLREKAMATLQSDEVLLAQLQIEEENRDKLIEMFEQQLQCLIFEYDKVAELYADSGASMRELNQKLLDRVQAETVLQGHKNDKKLFPKRREQREASVRAGKQEVLVAQMSIERCTVTAPWDGQVAEMLVQQGEYVRVGQPLLTLLDPTEIEVLVELPVVVRDEVRVGAGCRLCQDAMPELVWSGTVARIPPNASDVKQTFQVIVDVQSRDRKGAVRGDGEGLVRAVRDEHPLEPGLFLRAEIESCSQELSDGPGTIP
jgi:multidrug resistance efflux pump